MLNLMRNLVLLSITLIFGCASWPWGKSFDSAMGEWSWKTSGPNNFSESGKMTIVDETRATYPYRKGRILFYAIDDQDIWQGHWVESKGNYDCANSKDGSTDWGGVAFQFNDTYNQFKGEWDFCGEGKKYRWNGYR